MKKTLSAIFNVAFAIAIAVALSFGAATAFSGTPAKGAPSDVCTYPDYCEYKQDCWDICVEQHGHADGFCVDGKNCCSCVD